MWPELAVLGAAGAGLYAVYEVPVWLVAYAALWLAFPSWLLALPALPVAAAFAWIARKRSSAPAAFAAASAIPYLGPWVFNRLLMPVFAPYKASMGASILEWRATRVRASITQRFWVQNPFASIDLGALTSLGELVAFGLVVGALERRFRCLPVGVSARFFKKARGTCVVSSFNDKPTFNAVGEHETQSEVRDAKGDLCATVTVTFVVSERK